MHFSRFSRKQMQVLTWWKHPKASKLFQAIIADGAVRSGKTLSMSVSFVLWAMDTFDGENFAICGKTVESCKRNVVTPLLTAIGGIVTFKQVQSKNYIEARYRGHTNRFYVFGGKDEGSAALIQGVTLAGVLLDEVALMPRSFVEQALARCSVESSKFWFNCNPDSPKHWFYEEWILDPGGNKHRLYLHFTMDDNLTLSQEIKARYKSLYSGVFYDRFIRGLWVVAQGAVYRVFTEHKSRYYTDAPNYDFIQIGIDFGGNKSAHTFCASGITNDCSKLTALMSERHEAQGLSPDDLYNLLDLFVQKVTNKYGIIKVMYADSAEQTLINGIKGRFDIPVKNSIKNEIIDRIRGTTGLMSSGRFFITQDCESLVGAFETAVYDDKELTDVRLDDGTSDIDSLDAFEYSWERYLRSYTRQVM